jgi:hypothetical protein
VERILDILRFVDDEDFKSFPSPFAQSQGQCSTMCIHFTLPDCNFILRNINNCVLYGS